jgi:hypothetical protein
MRKLLCFAILLCGCGENLSTIGKDKGGECLVERNNATYIEKTQQGIVNNYYRPIVAVQVYEYNEHQYLRFKSSGGEQPPVHDPDCPKCKDKK